MTGFDFLRRAGCGRVTIFGVFITILINLDYFWASVRLNYFFQIIPTAIRADDQDG